MTKLELQKIMALKFDKIYENFDNKLKKIYDEKNMFNYRDTIFQIFTT